MPLFTPKDTWEVDDDGRIQAGEIEDGEEPKGSVPADRTQTPPVDPHD